MGKSGTFKLHTCDKDKELFLLKKFDEHHNIFSNSSNNKFLESGYLAYFSVSVHFR